MKTFTRGTSTTVFACTFTMGSNGEKNWGDTFPVQYVYSTVALSVTPTVALSVTPNSNGNTLNWKVLNTFYSTENA